MQLSCGGAAVILIAMVVAACGSTSTPVSQPESSTTVAAPIITGASAATTAAPKTVPPDPALAQAGAAGQAVVVTAERYGATTATFTAYERDGADPWRRAFGPWSARLGARGLAPPDEKREGDGRTPSGVYGFEFFFGVAPDPGVRFPYRRVTSTSIVWDDDPDSPLYNTWVDSSRQQAGNEPEPMYIIPAYDHGAVIAYNTARTPGLGSAIFLHVSNGGPTAGCVSLPAGQLVDVLRWLDPRTDPRIVLGVAG